MLLVGLSWACPDPAEAIDQARIAVLDVRALDAKLALNRAVEGFGCGTPAEPAQVATFFLAEAMRRSLSGEDPNPAFAAAFRADSSVWVSDYGPVNYEAWRQAGSETDVQSGALVLVPTPSLRSTWVDGVEATATSTHPTGLHLVQLGLGPVMDFAMVVEVLPDERVEVATGIAPLPVPVAVQKDPVKLPEPPSPWLLSSGGAAVAAVGLGIAGARMTPVMEQATDVDSLDQAYASQKLRVRSAYVLAGVSAVTFTVYVDHEVRNLW